MPEGERIARLEQRFISVDEKLEDQRNTLDELVQGVQQIHIMIANESGKRSVMKYIAHALTVIAGGLAGMLSATASATITKHLNIP